MLLKYSGNLITFILQNCVLYILLPNSLSDDFFSLNHPVILVRTVNLTKDRESNMICLSSNVF